MTNARRRWTGRMCGSYAAEHAALPAAAALRGAQSKSRLEDHFAFQCEALKLPPFEREHRFATEVGKQHRFDFSWDIYRVAVECDGFKTASVAVPIPGAGYRRQTVIVTGHGTPAQIQSDAAKRNMAAMLGWFVLVFHETAIFGGQAIAMTQRVLVARGWKPVVAPRPVRAYSELAL